MLNGTHPNPNLQVHRRGPNQNKRSRDGGLLGPPQSSNSASSASGMSGLGGLGGGGGVGSTTTTTTTTGRASAPAVQVISSLTSHLLNRNQNVFQAATQQPFLSHAGCGTLAAGPLTQWMIQDSILARGYIRFIGGLLAKVRLPAVQNSQFHPLYRTVDLLLSALNNVRREMQFFEITATKYGLQLSDDAPTHITKAHLDLYMSASSAGSSLLEGMVIVWATEHVSNQSLFKHDTFYRTNIKMNIKSKYSFFTTVLPDSVALCCFLFSLPQLPIDGHPYRCSPSSPDTKLDISSVYQVRRRLPHTR